MKENTLKRWFVVRRFYAFTSVHGKRSGCSRRDARRRRRYVICPIRDVREHLNGLAIESLREACVQLTSGQPLLFADSFLSQRRAQAPPLPTLRARRGRLVVAAASAVVVPDESARRALDELVECVERLLRGATARPYLDEKQAAAEAHAVRHMGGRLGGGAYLGRLGGTPTKPEFIAPRAVPRACEPQLELPASPPSVGLEASKPAVHFLFHISRCPPWTCTHSGLR